MAYGLTPFPRRGGRTFPGKSGAEFAQEPSQFARMAPGPSRRRGRPALPTPRIWLTAGALLAVACQGGRREPGWPRRITISHSTSRRDLDTGVLLDHST